MGTDFFYYLNIAGSCLSLIGCFYILVTVLIFHELRKFMFRLIMYLAIANIFISISSFLPFFQSTPICKAQAVILSFGTISNLLWTACIMYSIYQLLVNEHKSSLKFEIITSAVIWSISIILSLIMLPYYDEGKLWCWINASHNQYQALTAFYIPYFLVVIFNLVTWIKIKIHLKKSPDYGEVFQLKQSVMKKFMFYPIILILCYFPVFIHRFFNTNFDSVSDFIFSILSILGNSLVGFSFFIIYALTRSVRSTVYNFFSPKIQTRDYSLLSADKLIKY